jgi:hypothetical protein
VWVCEAFAEPVQSEMLISDTFLVVFYSFDNEQSASLVTQRLFKLVDANDEEDDTDEGLKGSALS